MSHSFQDGYYGVAISTFRLSFINDNAIFADNRAFVSSCVVHVSLTDNRLCTLNFYRATDITHALVVNIPAAERSNIIHHKRAIIIATQWGERE